MGVLDKFLDIMKLSDDDDDYEVAIEEGATMVRVGTGIFGKRNYALDKNTR